MRKPSESLLSVEAQCNDPFIVDAFVRIHKELSEAYSPEATPNTTESAPSPHKLAPASEPRLDEIAASTSESLAMYELVQALGLTDSRDIGGIVANNLRRLVPFSLFALYLYDSATDELEAVYTAGDVAPNVKGLRIPLGQRLSGWVAVNRQTIINSDPTLDLAELARAESPRLRTCLAAPLLASDQMVGVLALYSSSLEGFTENHRRILEVVAVHTAAVLRRLDESTRSARPSTASLKAAASSVTDGLTDVREVCSVGFVVIFIELIGLEKLRATYERKGAWADFVGQVVERARGELRQTDIVFQSGEFELAAFLNAVEMNTASEIAHRICSSLKAKSLRLQSGELVGIEVSVSISGPGNDAPLKEMLSSARQLSRRSGLQFSGSSIH